MKKSLLSLSIISTMLLSSGCMTAMLWGESPVQSTTSTYQVIKHDQLLSFGKAIEKHQTEQKFVVIGKENLYVIEKGNDQISKVINLTLPDSKLEIVTASDHNLRLRINQSNQNNQQILFHTYLTLQWTLNNPSPETLEYLKKEAKNFRLIPKDQQTLVQFNIPLEGHIYANQNNIAHDQNQKFVGQYGIEIGYDQSQKNLNLENLAGNLMGTPLALAADVIITPFAAVGVIVGLPAQAVKKLKKK